MNTPATYGNQTRGSHRNSVKDCLICTRSRRECDGEKPACSQCTASGEACSYRTGREIDRCGECTRAKARCDEQKPSCSRCIESHLKCKYDSQTQALFALDNSSRTVTIKAQVLQLHNEGQAYIKIAQTRLVQHKKATMRNYIGRLGILYEEMEDVHGKITEISERDRKDKKMMSYRFCSEVDLYHVTVLWLSLRTRRALLSDQLGTLVEESNLWLKNLKGKCHDVNSLVKQILAQLHQVISHLAPITDRRADLRGAFEKGIREWVTLLNDGMKTVHGIMIKPAEVGEVWSKVYKKMVEIGISVGVSEVQLNE